MKKTLKSIKLHLVTLVYKSVNHLEKIIKIIKPVMIIDIKHYNTLIKELLISILKNVNTVNRVELVILSISSLRLACIEKEVILFELTY